MRVLSSCLALVVLALVVGAPAGRAARDDTDVLQAKLDGGGDIFLPRLRDGACYATRGLWLSRDDTRITSDGACIVALGPGPARLDPRAPHPHTANAVFYVNHSSVRAPAPARVLVEGVRITVPQQTDMNGIVVVGHETTLQRVSIDGAPLTGIVVGSGTPGAAGAIGRTDIRDSSVAGARRDGIAVSGPIGLDVEHTVVSNARRSGIHIRSADRGQPVLDTRLVGNTIRRSGGPGIFLDLDPVDGPPLLASGIDVSGNRLSGNALTAKASRRAAVVVAGSGDIRLRDNVYRGTVGRRVLRLRPQSTAPTPARRVAAPPSSGDDTAWLQAQLDAGGGTIFLPKLPGGGCYATRGLWVSHDRTTITSDGACIVALGPGPVRVRSSDGDPVAADAVFFVNRSGPRQAAPVDVTISNLRIVVPAGLGMFGVAVFGHHVTLSRLDIEGEPKDDVLISGRANGNSYAGGVALLDSTLSGADRNAVSATGVIGLRVERNVIHGVRDAPPGQPGAGIDVEPDTRDRPALDIHIVGNTISDNAGPGILLELDANEGPAIFASGLEISGNTIVRNALVPTPPKRAGIVLAGGQDGGTGTLSLKGNVIRANGGVPILETHFTLVLDASGNDVG